MKWISVILGLLFLLPAYPKETTPPSAKQKSAYTPWYTGSLIASSGVTTPPNVFSFQPYFVFQSNYGIYDESFNFHSRPNTLIVNPQLLIEGGINKYMDFQLYVQTTTKYQGSKNKTEFTDTSLMIGFQVYSDTESDLYMRLAYLQIFPTGNYQRLDPNKNGVDISGAGVFQSDIALFIQKSYYWFYNHPVVFTWNFSVGYNSKVRVHGFNAYGGGLDAVEDLRPGMVFTVLFAPQFSITQKWNCFSAKRSMHFLLFPKSRWKRAAFPNMDIIGMIV